MPLGIPNLMYRERVTTAADGTLAWNFPSNFPAGVTPVVQLTPEENDSVLPVFAKLLTVSNTGISLKTMKTSDLTVLGIHLLGLTVGAACIVHICVWSPF